MSTTDRHVTVAVAGQVTGVPERTIRRWIRAGKLPAIDGQRGHLVSLPDVQHLADMTGREPVMSGHEADVSGQSATMSGYVTGHVAESLPATDNARQQLDMIRDEWLAPLIDRIGTLERENGRLEFERDHAVAERDQLQTRVVELEAKAKPAAQVMGELATMPAFQRIAPTPTDDALHARVAALEAEQAAAPTATGDEAQTRPRRAWWRFWGAS